MMLENPIWILLGLVVIVFLAVWRFKVRISLMMPFGVNNENKSKKTMVREKVKAGWSEILLYLGLFCFFIGLSSPYTLTASEEARVNGVGIMVVMDLSGTMAAEDLLPGNRLNVSKRVLTTFINHRGQDLVGLIVFGTDAFLVSPLTLDHKRLIQQLESVQVGSIDGMTAIGTAITKGLNHMRKANLHSKVMILMTDGENNAGDIDPLVAAKISHAIGIKIYTIGLGKTGGAPIPYIHPVYGKRYLQNPDGTQYLTKLDEPLLQQIASITGGHYYRATDTSSLYKITDYINALEKTDIKAKRWEDRQSNIWPFVFSGLLLVIAYGVVHYIILRRWVS